MMRPGRTALLAAGLVAGLATTHAIAAAGQQAYATCVACHGARAEGNPGLGAPALAGQQLAYLQRQLLNFRSGLRGAHKDDAYGAQMRAGAQTVLGDEKAITAVAAYIAGLPATSVKPAGKFDARNGNNLYQGKCGACHGGRAEGNAALSAPRLAGLDAVYMKRQIQHFKLGRRGAQPQDRYGKQMALMAGTLASERDLDDVIGYIHSASVSAVTAAESGLHGLTPDGFVLSRDCPPSFELVANGTCVLRDLYEFYDSLQDRGVGGTRTSLPPHRDGYRPEQIDLGRYLFFDPLLSGDGTLSCASCHRPDQGFADGRPRSIGIHGQDAGRAAPTLWNVAFLQTFFWDARAASLEAQAPGPLFSPREMGNEPQRLLRNLNSSAAYRELFRQAFPGGDDTITVGDVYTALAAFQTTLISLNSRYDRYAQGHAAALSEREIAGLNVFRSFVARCAECHTPPLFTNGQVAVIGAPEPRGRPFDIGAEKTFGAARLRGGFKVPTLRNIALTAPYMHSGAFSTLRETVEFYNKGRGNAVPEGTTLYLHWHISSPNLSGAEVGLLVDFLQALSDDTFKPAIPRRVPSGLPPLDNPEGIRS